MPSPRPHSVQEPHAEAVPGQEVARDGCRSHLPDRPALLGRHLACGEERFTVEFNHSDQTVWYEVYCFSRAKHWLAKLAYPYLRLQQSRFRHLSALAMQRSVAPDAADRAIHTAK